MGDAYGWVSLLGRREGGKQSRAEVVNCESCCRAAPSRMSGLVGGVLYARV